MKCTIFRNQPLLVTKILHITALISEILDCQVAMVPEQSGGLVRRSVEDGVCQAKNSLALGLWKRSVPRGFDAPQPKINHTLLLLIQ